ncbi:uncharacterized protein [Clytia hemisphaerica]|uniref:Uncharacterized protein n=1 Tax=Clytia hemisphaerica TaxID=252671 RepID=A0A7M6DMV3_9CNID|eukprot:TCONS_00065183-protein
MPFSVDDIDKLQLKRYIKLMVFRLVTLAAHYLAVMDALASLVDYAAILQGSDKRIGTFNLNLTSNFTTTPLPIKDTETTKALTRAAKIGLCNMKKAIKQDELDSLLINFNMSFFLLLGFYGIAVIAFVIGIVVNLRLCLCPVTRDTDKMGNELPCIWDKIKGATFNLATFPCDTAIMSCIVGLYAVKRGSAGLGCWQCFKTPTCRSQEDIDGILLGSSISMNINFILVVGIVFYKGFVTYFRATDPEKCECHCVAPRCVTGCFISLVVTSVVMMPPFLVMKTKYFDLKEINPGFFADIMDKMMLVGIIIWAVAGVAVLVVMPLKRVLLGGDDEKKK